ncbi:asparaginase [Anaerocolumna xylanovorans]|uniref:asparaginase n=1 Tax=Anaerocolumna xylanovorans DSM 12503 TaxID=1121345 RepID=A0A1M7Y1T3_9FIRM|nr:asparaginase [Anaerocolumna xylanovorans]SHO45807.1 L-asparaginase [Anaerocolumna xylanovorans DSM 12503]
MKRVLVLTTGGTILSFRTAEGLKPVKEDVTELLNEKLLKLSGEYEIDVETVFNKDSSNIVPEDWYIVKDSIQRSIDKYDGIVILHGTDTMSYSAAMLSFLFAEVNKAIILTGSQIPLSYKDSDGGKNLRDAVIAAGDSRLKGVFVVFHDKVINGTRAYKRSSINKDAYISCNYPYVGVIKDNKLFITQEYRDMKDKEHDAGLKILELKDKKIPKIFVLKMIPGIEASLIDYILKEGYQGVIIEGYGLGGMPVDNKELMAKIDLLASKRIPVIMATQCVYDGVNLDTYEVGMTAKKNGILSAYDMTTEAVYTKLMWGLSCTDSYEDLVKLLQTNLCGELAVRY